MVVFMQTILWIAQYFSSPILLAILGLYSSSARGLSGFHRTSPCPRHSFGHIYVRDSDDCKTFHVCFGRRSWTMVCPGNTVFSSKFKVCVWPGSAKDDCKEIRPKIDSTTLSELSTTPRRTLPTVRTSIRTTPIAGTVQPTVVTSFVPKMHKKRKQSKKTKKPFPKKSTRVKPRGTTSLPNVMEQCGEVITSTFIIGGQPSQPGRWPWQVSLQIISAGYPWHRCGGVLVHPLWVVTAGHCVEGPFYGNLKNWRVVLAEDDLDYDSGVEIHRSISRIVSHPGYLRTSNFPNDIAMLHLNEPIDVQGNNVRVACLPQDSFQLFGYENCWISGWGETRGSGRQNSLNELQVQIVPNTVCRSMWGRVDIEVLDQQVCVGHGDTGACYGDSGGPLMCEVNGTYYLGGVMSWLINNCSARGFPNVFTRVQSYLEWIRDNIEYSQWWHHN